MRMEDLTSSLDNTSLNAISNEELERNRKLAEAFKKQSEEGLAALASKRKL
jgi:hypothetical protein